MLIQRLRKQRYLASTPPPPRYATPGAFYATDSNSAGQRGRTMVSNKTAWVPTVPAQCSQRENCIAIPRGDASESPPGYLTWDNGAVNFAPWDGDGLEPGAGFWDAGNPNNDNRQGGGAGCHINVHGIDGSYESAPENVINQINIDSASGKPNFDVGDLQCQCNADAYRVAVPGSVRSPYDTKDWYNWAFNFKEHRGFHFGRGDTISCFGMQAMGACWHPSPRDMLTLSNRLWEMAYPNLFGGATYETWWWWLPTSWTTSAQQQRQYWGWNEITMNKALVYDSTTWGAMTIKLPSAAMRYDAQTKKAVWAGTANIKSAGVAYDGKASEFMDTLTNIVSSFQDTQDNSFLANLEAQLDNYTTVGVYSINRNALIRVPTGVTAQGCAVDVSMQVSSRVVIAREWVDGWDADRAPTWKREFFNEEFNVHGEFPIKYKILRAPNGDHCLCKA